MTREAAQADELLLVQMISMGFDKDHSARALVATGNRDIDVAINWIFEHPQPEASDAPPQPMEDVSAVPAPAELSQAPAVDPLEDAELDDEMKRIVNNAKKGGPAAADAQAAPGERKVVDMTHEEKMEWLSKRRAEAKVKREKEAIELEKSREKSRQQIGKAAIELKEAREKVQAEAVIRQKQREAKEKAEARKRILQKIEEDKQRRKREQEAALAAAKK